MNGRQSFAPQEFIESLRRDEIRPPIIFFGMVKPADDDDQYLLFAHGYACANWIRIPLSSLETVELLNLAPCEDHTHPLVLLHLKQPQTDEGRLFSSLVQATTGRTAGPSSYYPEHPPTRGGPRRVFRTVRRRGGERPVPPRFLARSAPAGCNDYEIDDAGIWTFHGVNENGDCTYELTDPAISPGF